MIVVNNDTNTPQHTDSTIATPDTVVINTQEIANATLSPNFVLLPNPAEKNPYDYEFKMVAKKISFRDEWVNDTFSIIVLGLAYAYANATPVAATLTVFAIWPVGSAVASGIIYYLDISTNWKWSLILTVAAALNTATVVAGLALEVFTPGGVVGVAVGVGLVLGAYLFIVTLARVASIVMSALTSESKVDEPIPLPV